MAAGTADAVITAESWREGEEALAEGKVIWLMGMTHFRGLVEDEIHGLDNYGSRFFAVARGLFICAAGVLSARKLQRYLRTLIAAGIEPPHYELVEGDNVIDGTLKNLCLRGQIADFVLNKGWKICFYVGGRDEERFLAELGLDWTHTLNTPFHSDWGNKVTLRERMATAGLRDRFPRHRIMRSELFVGSKRADLAQIATSAGMIFAGWRKDGVLGAPSIGTFRHLTFVVKVEGGDGGSLCSGAINFCAFRNDPSGHAEALLILHLIGLARSKNRRVIVEAWLHHDEWMDVGVVFNVCPGLSTDAILPVYMNLQLVDTVHEKYHVGCFMGVGKSLIDPALEARIIARLRPVLAVMCAGEHPLAGRFSVDVLVHRETGEVRVLEVNPRWTASWVLYLHLLHIQARTGLPTFGAMENIECGVRSPARVARRLHEAGSALRGVEGAVVTAPLVTAAVGKTTILTSGTGPRRARAIHDRVRQQLGEAPRFGEWVSGGFAAITIETTAVA